MHIANFATAGRPRIIGSAVVVCAGFKLLPPVVALLAALGFAPHLRAQPAAESRLFRAGAAQTDITPDLGALLVGSWVSHPARHIHDNLHARALVLDDGANRVAMVVCDNVGLPREVCDEAKRLIKEHTQLPGSHVLISSTHTHSGPSASADIAPLADAPGYAYAPLVGPRALNPYQQFVAKRVADAVQCAINNLEPARIGWGSANEPAQVFNRRWFVSDEEQRRNPFGGIDKVRTNPSGASAGLIRPAGPTDPEIAFVSVQTRDGTPIALLAAYSVHYVGGVPSGVISADYFGCFSDRMRELLGTKRREQPFVGMMANGTSGDVNNVNRAVTRPASPPYERMREVANSLADAVFRAYQNIEHHEWVSIDARYEELKVQPRLPSAEMISRAQKLLAEPARTPPWHLYERFYASLVLELAKAPEQVELPLQVFRIGDLGIMAIPTEVFAEIGLELKTAAPFKKAFAISLANGEFGYLPTVNQHKLGGYETWVGTNKLEIEASPKIVAALLGLAGELQPRP